MSFVPLGEVKPLVYSIFWRIAALVMFLSWERGLLWIPDYIRIHETCSLAAHSAA